MKEEIESHENRWGEFSKKSDQIKGECKGLRVVCLRKSRKVREDRAE